MSICYICLGSNKGDRVGNVQQATRLLASDESQCRVVRTSALYETEPWGNKNQNWFVNAILECKTKLSPKELLEKCMHIESLIGRDRLNEEKWGERVIDIDILFYDDEIIEEENLTIPHPYIHERSFVLVPLLELIPNYVHPKLKKTLSDLYDELENVEEVVLYGTRM